MKDVAYFLGSCLSEEQCESQEAMLLDFYFEQLRSALTKRQSDFSLDAIEHHWRELYPWAWADFTRFMLGWCPGHSKLNRYSRRITASVVEQLS